jgi:SM-20-related protein
VLDDMVKDAAIVSRARSLLASNGRIHLPGILHERSARDLHQAMLSADWRLALNSRDSVYDLKPEDVAAMDVAQREGALRAVHANAANQFQFLYDSVRISDLCEGGQMQAGPFAELFALLNAPATLQVLRALTGEPRIAYLDAQATRYRPGHFLTQHDDGVEGKHRLFAYVLNLTPNWRVDWGGLLLFISPDGHVAEAYTPAWNALNILKVPQPHAVSVVAPFAGAFRYSITGWMRSQRP